MSSQTQPSIASYAVGVGVAPNELLNPIVANRAPTSSDSEYPIGKRWIFTTSNIEYGLTSKNSSSGVVLSTWTPLGTAAGSLDTITTQDTTVVIPSSGNINVIGTDTIQTSGSGDTVTISPTLGGYPITSFVVGVSGQAGYQTIQDALDAADSAGGGVVYIQPGTYTEDLTLYDSVDLYATPAVSQNQGVSVTIVGTHTPPTTGHVGFNSICFISTTDVFFSAAAGSTHLVFLNCESAVENGYFLNLDNWTGIFEFFDINPSTAGAPFAVNDGGINNSGGATLFAFAAGLGSGSNTMNLSGVVIAQGCGFQCPVDFGSGSEIFMDAHVFSGPVTFSGNSNGAINSSRFDGSASAAITMSSSGNIEISNSIIQSSNNPSIDGAGAGTLSLGDITFLDNSSIAGTITASWLPTKLGNTTVTGNLIFNTAGNKIISSSVATNSTAGANSFGSVTLAGGTATVSTTSVTTNSLILIWRQSIGATGAAALGDLTVGTITNGVSFVINAVQAANATALQATDVSIVGWVIVN